MCRWTRLEEHPPASTNPHKSAQSQQGVTVTPLALSLPQLYLLALALNTDSYRVPYSALQGAAQGRATISLLVNKYVSYNPRARLCA